MQRNAANGHRKQRATPTISTAMKCARRFACVPAVVAMARILLSINRLAPVLPSSVLSYLCTHHFLYPIFLPAFGNRQKSVNHNNKANIMPFCVK
jgi:hypothetical protein